MGAAARLVATDDPLFVVDPRDAVVGCLADPAERVRGDVTERPPLPRLVVEALQNDGVADGPADEPAHPPVRRVDPSRAPGAGPCVIEADGRAGEPGTAWHRKSGPAH